MLYDVDRALLRTLLLVFPNGLLMRSGLMLLTITLKMRFPLSLRGL